jgi:hypothetical protein
VCDALPSPLNPGVNPTLIREEGKPGPSNCTLGESVICFQGDPVRSSRLSPNGTRQRRLFHPQPLPLRGCRRTRGSGQRGSGSGALRVATICSKGCPCSGTCCRAEGQTRTRSAAEWTEREGSPRVLRSMCPTRRTGRCELTSVGRTAARKRVSGCGVKARADAVPSGGWRSAQGRGTPRRRRGPCLRRGNG